MNKNGNLRITLTQYNIAWEDKSKNITYIRSLIESLAGQTDIVILPEMCTTGFTMNTSVMAEDVHGNTITQLKEMAKENDLAICGSLIIHEAKSYYNRAFFISPNQEFYYDKRHLFRIGREDKFYSEGNKKTIFEHKGFNICLQVCYDLRFPVWIRNTHNKYDLLIFVANWPEPRRNIWEVLLKARAIENMCYVCGVNRIGADNNNLNHAGDSMLIDSRGNEMLRLPRNQECVETITINIDPLLKDRSKFPVWKDADRFKLED